jgi:two-component system nitrogen regulation sensor histidine kinase NtrY
MAVGLRDERHAEWRVASNSPLAIWSDPALEARRGQVALAAAPYRWAAEPLESGLWIVVAIPATELENVTRDLTRLSALATAAAVLAAALAALWFSAWIARPVQRLARALPAVARGERGDAMPVTGAAEVAQLAAEFNRMTAELFESRERLLQAERVAAWREMARRLAHELKNPIFPIQVSIETLRRVFDRDAARYASGEALDDDEFGRLFRESCDTILDELRLLRGIIDEFSRFARLPQPHFAPTDIGLLVEQVLALHRPGAGLVTIETELAQGLPPILADRDLLSHALGNLVANAFEAMPDGGVLRVHTLRTAAGVAVAIEDSGPGMPEEQRRRLFTPYFTTKKGGTGLGLSIAQSIVADHGGRIEVRTEAGRGTTFTLILPSRPPIPAAARAADGQSD